MKPVLVFDLNETLLDLASLDPAFARIFVGPGADAGPDGAAIRATWFAQLLALFLTATVVDRYRSFDDLTGDALTMIAAQRRHALTDEDRATVRDALGRMPAHADVHTGMRQLKAAGYTVAVLTNSTRESAVQLVEQAGLADLLDVVLSADTVRRYKPAREAYAHAASELGVALDEVCLVAAHGWDITGALAAGCRAAFIARDGKSLDPGSPAPGIIARDVPDLARQLGAADH